ncbi:hypothetical protein ACTQ2N_04935 [Ruminococcus sp. LCP21S3_E8]
MNYRNNFQLENDELAVKEVMLESSDNITICGIYSSDDCDYLGVLVDMKFENKDMTYIFAELNNDDYNKFVNHKITVREIVSKSEHLYQLIEKDTIEEDIVIICDDDKESVVGEYGFHFDMVDKTINATNK